MTVAISVCHELPTGSIGGSLIHQTVCASMAVIPNEWFAPFSTQFTQSFFQGFQFMKLPVTQSVTVAALIVVLIGWALLATRSTSRARPLPVTVAGSDLHGPRHSSASFIRLVAANTAEVQADDARQQKNSAKKSAEEKSRRSRLEAYSAAMLSWVDTECSLTPNQRRKLNEVLNTEIERLKTTVPDPEHSRIAAWGHNGYSPIEFVVLARMLSHGTTVQEHLMSLLTTDQKEKLEIALKNRDRSIRKGIANLATVRLDQELFLHLVSVNQ